MFDVGDQTVDNYHGYVAYNFGDSDAAIRPYVLGGLGCDALQQRSAPFSALGQTRQIDGNSKFSTTWGLGLKIYPEGLYSFGLNFLGARWTPTYIKPSATGWWCDPWYGCYVTGNAQYSNQFELSGGIIAPLLVRAGRHQGVALRAERETRRGALNRVYANLNFYRVGGARGFLPCVAQRPTDSSTVRRVTIAPPRRHAPAST